MDEALARPPSGGEQHPLFPAFARPLLIKALPPIRRSALFFPSTCDHIFFLLALWLSSASSPRTQDPLHPASRPNPSTMLFKSLLVAAGAATLAVAQRPSNVSICDYYTTALLKNNTAANQLTLLTLVVNTAVIGNCMCPTPLSLSPSARGPSTDASQTPSQTSASRFPGSSPTARTMAPPSTFSPTSMAVSHPPTRVAAWEWPSTSSMTVERRRS